MSTESMPPDRRDSSRRALRIVRFATLIYTLLIVGIVVSAINNWFRPAFRWVEGGIGDKPMHFILVGSLTMMINLSWRSATWFRIQRGTLVMAALATTEELSQLFFVNRTCDLQDGLHNLAGILILGWLARPLSKYLGICSPRIE